MFTNDPFANAIILGGVPNSGMGPTNPDVAKAKAKAKKVAKQYEKKAAKAAKQQLDSMFTMGVPDPARGWYGR